MSWKQSYDNGMIMVVCFCPQVSIITVAKASGLLIIAKTIIFSKNQSYHFVNTIPPAKDSFRPCSVTDSDSKILSQCKSVLNKSAK